MSNLYGGNNLNMNGMGNSEPGNIDKRNKILLYGGIAAVGIIILLFIIVAVMSSMENQKNNLSIDSKITKINKDIFIIDENNVPYVSVEKITPLLGYEFYSGEYGNGNEDKSFCYVKNSQEVAILEMDSNILYKSLLSGIDKTFDYYEMSYPVVRINNSLFISLPTMQKAFNVKYRYNTENNNLIINTLPKLVARYDSEVKAKNYDKLATDFSNQKALIYDMAVVRNKDGNMGVLSTLDYSTIIGTKYPELLFSEGMNEFIAESNGKIGVLKIVNNEIKVKLGFNFDDMSLIDNNLGLYLVQSNGLYGVLDKSGKIIIDIEYDKIGLDNVNLFPTDNVRNQYVLYDNCIPVNLDKKWGMFDIKGKKLLNVSYHGFGSIASTSTNQSGQNVLLIPDTEGVEGIVVSLKNSANQVKYGVIDNGGIFRVAPSFNSIYKKTTGGETEYYMLFGTTIMKVEDKLRNEASTGNNGTVQID